MDFSSIVGTLVIIFIMSAYSATLITGMSYWRTLLGFMLMFMVMFGLYLVLIEFRYEKGFFMILITMMLVAVMMAAN